MVYKLAKYPFNLTWNLVFMLVTVILWRIAPPSSLKTAFKLLTTTTVRHNPNSKRYETFMQLIKTISYSYLRWRRVAGVDCKKFRLFGVIIEVRANSKTKGLERGRKRRARLWRDARTLRGSDTLMPHRRFVRFKKRFRKKKTDCFVVFGWDKEWLSKMLVVKKNKHAFTYQILKTWWVVFTLNVWWPLRKPYFWFQLLGAII